MKLKPKKDVNENEDSDEDKGEDKEGDEPASKGKEVSTNSTQKVVYLVISHYIKYWYPCTSVSEYSLRPSTPYPDPSDPDSSTSIRSDFPTQVILSFLPRSCLLLCFSSRHLRLRLRVFQQEGYFPQIRNQESIYLTTSPHKTHLSVPQCAHAPPQSAAVLFNYADNTAVLSLGSLIKSSKDETLLDKMDEDDIEKLLKALKKKRAS
ncbi:hypothetical protein C8Q75DRAFT_811043 [Abortiporus biennis]|nr:hypothetical protein C8Q75DRAFT_811043 [Abortiporus biennis]